MIDIDYWGNHQIDLDSKTLYFNRESGLCSNIGILLHLIVHLKVHRDFIPYNIVTNFFSYKNLNIYEELIHIENIDKWKDYSKDDAAKMINKAHPSWWGWGNSKEEIDFNTVSVLLDVFFNYNSIIKEEIEKIYNESNINRENYSFLLWRQTDKTSEIANNEYPSLDDALTNFKDYKNLIAHTDDEDIYKALLNKNIKTLNILPRDPNRGGGHFYLNSISEEAYLLKFGCTRLQHVAKLIALLNVASKSKVFIGYPGNMTFIICLLRGNFQNVSFFRKKGHIL